MNILQSRIIVVREPNGTLRKANADERHNVNQIYFPQSGRELKHPVMFEDEHLKVEKLNKCFKIK